MASPSSRILTTTTVRDTQGQQQLLRYPNGTLLRGKIAVNLIWYGKFEPSQRAIVADFITSLSASPPARNQQPSVAMWWKTIEKFYHPAGTKNPNSPSLFLGKQIVDEKLSLGKSLSENQIVQLASKGDAGNAVNVVLTAASAKKSRFAYIWVGNSETRCPGYCAWPFHQPIYGPQPATCCANNDVGLDGIVMSLSGLLAGTATNPFGDGFYQGPKEAPLEAATACSGVYGSGAYPGYAGNLLVDQTTGASYNAHGANGRKYPGFTKEASL
ncbi:Protein PHOSPHATE-INDUCED 1 [Orobanche gracilis]